MAFITQLLLLFLAILLTTAQDREEQCYWRSNGATGVITDGGWFACNNTQQVAGGSQLCCLQGSECGTDALCHQPSSGGGSGWFVGGCTDPSYQDPVCRSSCTNDAQTWIQYNYTSQLWHCCGDNGCTGTPTSETFQAAPPEQFSAVPSGPQSSSLSSSSSPTTSPKTASSETASAASEGLSTGAKAGIGVLAAVSAIAIAAALAFFILWRRAKKGQGQGQGRGAEERWQQEQQQGMMQQHNVYAHYGSQPANYYPSSPSPQPPQEVGVDAARRPELAGDAVDERK